jgi:hypothetical protein
MWAEPMVWGLAFFGLRAASWDGPPDVMAGWLLAAPAAWGADEPEVAHAVTANAEIRVRASAVAVLLGRTVLNDSELWRDQGGFA